MDWNDLRFFLAVANLKSLSAAATHLGVSPSTVSRRIEALETALKVSLFRSHRDGYDLTETGHDLVPAAERAEAQMRVFERSAQGWHDDYAGPVRIEAPELLGQDVLLPGLYEFLCDHPAIQIELRSSVRTTRLVGEESDIIIRLVRPDQGSYLQRRLGQISFGLYASKAYVARYGIPQRPEDLRNHRIIGWAPDLHYLTMAIWLEALYPGGQPIVRLSSLSAQLSAVRLGIGLAVLPNFAAQEADLVPALPEVSPLVSDLWILIHKRSGYLPRVEAVKNSLIEVINRTFET